MIWRCTQDVVTGETDNFQQEVVSDTLVFSSVLDKDTNKRNLTPKLLSLIKFSLLFGSWSTRITTKRAAQNKVYIITTKKKKKIQKNLLRAAFYLHTFHAATFQSNTTQLVSFVTNNPAFDWPTSGTWDSVSPVVHHSRCIPSSRSMFTHKQWLGK